MIYYIYAYISEKTGLPYYIGKGKKERAYEKHRKHIPVPKDKNRIVIMENNLTELGAFALERRYIKWYGKRIDNTGILINILDGGDGSTMPKGYYKPSKESIEKRANSNRGKRRSEETKKKMSLSALGRIRSKESKLKHSIAISGKKNFRYGKKLSEEHKNKIGLANKNKIRTEEQKQNHSIKMKDLWNSEEYRNKRKNIKKK